MSGKFVNKFLSYPDKHTNAG